MNDRKILYIALLRGINVGGNNIIKMIDLKICFEDMGFTDVSTYIQSGNVLFSSAEDDQIALTGKIEKSLEKRYGVLIRAVVVSYKELKHIVEDAPHGFGSKPDTYRYDVIFLKDPLRSSEAIKSVSVKEGVDHVYEGKNVLYFSRLNAKATQSRMSKIAGLPIYQNMTIRNWNTITKLLAMLGK